jgi:MSHA pilin protein MshD
MCTLPRQRGISLIELIMFIMIVGVALAGILLVMNTTTMGSANPMIRKQSLAIAESLLEEVELMPFTYCDPDDAAAATANSAADCTTAEGLGAENDVSRYDASLPFDNVSDYSGFSMPAGGILDITGTAIGPAAGYSATIAVVAAALGAVPAGESLRITVTVTGPDGVSVAVDGYRTRYSPRI